MADPAPPRAAGGALIALGAVGGAVTGLFLGETTLGFLIGLAVGLLAALLIWLRDRRGA